MSAINTSLQAIASTRILDRQLNRASTGSPSPARPAELSATSGLEDATRSIAAENRSAALAPIEDSDLANATTQNAKNLILNQSGAALRAHAQQSAQNVLNLLEI